MPRATGETLYPPELAGHSKGSQGDCLQREGHTERDTGDYQLPTGQQHRKLTSGLGGWRVRNSYYRLTTKNTATATVAQQKRWPDL